MALQNRSLLYLVDGSFFSKNSKYIAVCFILIKDKKKVASRDFITIVALKYYYVCTAELCRILAFSKLIEHTIRIEKLDKNRYEYDTYRDFTSVLQFLLSTLLSISNNSLLYQIKRKIMIIKYQEKLHFYLKKVRAYQDKVKQ